MAPNYVNLAMLRAMNLEVSPMGNVETRGGYTVGQQVGDDQFEISSALAEYTELCEEEFGDAVAGLL